MDALDLHLAREGATGTGEGECNCNAEKESESENYESKVAK